MEDEQEPSRHAYALRRRVTDLLAPIKDSRQPADLPVNLLIFQSAPEARPRGEYWPRREPLNILDALV